MKTFLELTSISLLQIRSLLTASKTDHEFILFGSRQRLLSTFDSSPSLEIDVAPISQVTFTKSLGVYIAQNVHVDNLCKKIAASIGVLKRSRAFVPFETLQTMYTSLVQPHFDCCNKTLSIKIVQRTFF